jgi:hypothetical protein
MPVKTVVSATRLDELANRPDQDGWVWNGGFRTVVEGAYYSKLLLLAKEQKRIDFVPHDPLMQVRNYFDIGGTGAGGCGCNLDRSIRRPENQRPGLFYEAQWQRSPSTWIGCARAAGAKLG